MLDTNVVSELLRTPAGRVARRIGEIGPENLALSIITAAELRYGAARRGSARLLSRVEAILDRLPILPLTAPVDAHYAHLRTERERIGRPIGPNDLLIAAHALALSATLVTANVNEFRRVSGLNVENWMS